MTCKAFVVCAMMLSLVAGCVRRPGQSYPYVSQSYAEDDVVYHGVGVRF